MWGDIFSALEIRTWTFLEAIILPTTLEFKTPTISFLVNMRKLNCPVPQFPRLARVLWGLNTVDSWIAWGLGLLIPWAVENPRVTTSWPSTKHRFPTADFKTHVIQGSTVSATCWGSEQGLGCHVCSSESGSWVVASSAPNRMHDSFCSLSEGEL